MPPVLDNIPVAINDCQVLRLRETGAEMCEKVTSCLVREGYSPVLELDIAVTNALYFFIKDRPVAQRVRRLKSVKGRPGPGGGKPRVVSLRRKMVTRQLSSGAGPGARTARAAPQKLAWWQREGRWWWRHMAAVPVPPDYRAGASSRAVSEIVCE